MVGEDAYYFFQAFFKNHPEYAKSPLYIIGESYGGYVFQKEKKEAHVPN